MDKPPTFASVPQQAFPNLASVAPMCTCRTVAEAERRWRCASTRPADGWGLRQGLRKKSWDFYGEPPEPEVSVLRWSNKSHDLAMILDILIFRTTQVAMKIWKSSTIHGDSWNFLGFFCSENMKSQELGQIPCPSALFPASSTNLPSLHPLRRLGS